MPARIGSGSVSQAATNSANSGSPVADSTASAPLFAPLDCELLGFWLGTEGGSSPERVELVERVLRARRILESESELTGVHRLTRSELRLLEDECRTRGFTLPETNGSNVVRGSDPGETLSLGRETTSRLPERLEQCQHEVATHRPETITHQEAACDLYLISQEIRRRKNNKG